MTTQQTTLPPGTREVLQVKGLTKAFSGIVANRDVHLTVREGETMAILGENGAGKSTLMRTLYGLQHPDGGTIRINASEVTLDNPRKAMRHGIGMVSQEFALVETLTVAENIALAPDGGGRSTLVQRFNRTATERRVGELARSIGLDVDPSALVGNLSIGVRQRVEILKALYNDTKILMLDEPTALLSPIEVVGLFRVIRELNQRGTAVLFVSHKLDEVLDIAHRVTVLRHGAVVAELDRQGLTKQALGLAMLGTEMRAAPNDAPPASRGTTVLEVKGLHLERGAQQHPLHDVALVLRDSEIVGVAGVDGNGQNELADVIAGLRQSSSGTVSLLGENVTGRDARSLSVLGVGYVPQDRKKVGSVGGFDVGDNLILKQFRSAKFSRRGCLSKSARETVTNELVEAFDVRLASTRNPVSSLSGGNLQKLILAREVGMEEPKLVVAMDPTRGVDFNAASAIWERLRKLRASGAAVLVFSCDLDELLASSDRIAVMSGGRIVDVLDRKEVTMEKLALLIGGSATGTEVDTEPAPPRAIGTD